MRKTNGRGLLPCIPKLNFLTIKYIFGGGGVVFAFIFVIYIILLSLRYIYCCWFRFWVYQVSVHSTGKKSLKIPKG